MAARYEVGTDKYPFYWVADKKPECSDDVDYYNVTIEASGLECDGEADACEESKCQHIKAVAKFIKASKQNV